MAEQQHKIKMKQAPQRKQRIILESYKYEEFSFLKGNRPIDTGLSKYKKLRLSMKKEGWIDSYPATVFIENGRKFITDGQNRFTAAKELGIPVLYRVVTKKYNIPALSDSFRPWNGNDYAGSHASEGNKNYLSLMEFCKRHSISAARAGNLLMAKTKVMHDSSGVASICIRDGTFKFTSEGLKYAETVLDVCLHLPKPIRKNRTANAAIARILLIPDVIVETLIQKLDANQGQVVAKATIDEYIQMIESIYNKRNQYPVPIAMKVLAHLRSK